MKQNDKLRELRRTLGLSQKDMGLKIGVSAASVAAFEGGACSFFRNASVKNRIMRFLTGEKESATGFTPLAISVGTAEGKPTPA